MSIATLDLYSKVFQFKAHLNKLGNLLLLVFQYFFTQQVVWTLLGDVKFGQTVAYKQLADHAGNSRAVRAVGEAILYIHMNF